MPPRTRRHRPAARRHGGLTLIELALALGIVAVLVGLAVPVYSGWQDKVKVNQATNDLIAMGAVIDSFALDSNRFPTSLAEVGFGQLKDPWGRAYEYVDLTTTKGNGKARKNRSLVPLNTDYDLYSKGADGASVSPLTAKASHDDILRANNGRFFGLASTY